MRPVAVVENVLLTFLTAEGGILPHAGSLVARCHEISVSKAAGKGEAQGDSCMHIHLTSGPPEKRILKW